MDEDLETTLRPHGPLLLDIAISAIEAALAGDQPEAPPSDLPACLLAPGASFVTLHRMGELRGCIGTSAAWRGLATDVADNATKAAFLDPRFPPLDREEFADLDVSISVLTPPRLMDIRDVNDLLAQLRPMADGLIIEDGPYRALFLPSVWKMLPEPRDFLGELARKGGFPPGYWSPTLRAWRFAAIEMKKG